LPSAGKQQKHKTGGLTGSPFSLGSGILVAILNFTITLLLFASMEVVSKPLMGFVDPLVLTLWRFVCGIVVLGAVMVFRRDKVNLSRGQVAVLALMGVLNTFLSMSLLQLAVKHTAASRAAAVFCSNPVFVVLLAALLGWEKFTKRKVLGLFLSVCGLLLVTDMHLIKIDAGTVYALLASIAFAAYILLGRKASLNTDPVTVNVLSFAFGITALALWLGVKGVSVNPEPLFRELPTFLFLGIGVSGLGYVTFISAIKKMGAGNASAIFLLKPAVATLLAILFINETFEIDFVIGLLLAGTGSYLVAGKRKKAGHTDPA
jgi:drug/metabolite transporter (DMT)-like permease